MWQWLRPTVSLLLNFVRYTSRYASTVLLGRLPWHCDNVRLRSIPWCQGLRSWSIWWSWSLKTVLLTSLPIYKMCSFSVNTAAEAGIDVADTVYCCQSVRLQASRGPTDRKPLVVLSVTYWLLPASAAWMLMTLRSTRDASHIETEACVCLEHRGTTRK